MYLYLILGSFATTMLIGLAISKIIELKKLKDQEQRLLIEMRDNLRSKNRLKVIREIHKLQHQYSDWTILNFANKYSWSNIIVSCLPKLYFTQFPKSKIIISFVWKEVLNLIPNDFDYIIIDKYCGGEIIKISMPKESYKFINEIALLLEDARLTNPYPSYESLFGVINQVVNEYELEMKNDNNIDLANRIQMKRKALLQDELKLFIA